MLIPSGPAYSWKKALLLIFFSTLFSLSLFAFLQTRGDQPVMAIIQEAQKEKVPTQLFAELLELSVDQPVSFAHFPLKEAKKRLEETSFIRTVSIKKIRPNALFIEYSLREPLALLGEKSNLGIDEEGVAFPLNYYTKREELPILYSKGKGHELFLKLLDLPVKLIDLTKVDAPSLGQREIVVQLVDGRWLRLPVHHMEEAVRHFKKCNVPGKIIDLRIPKTAYVYD